jgi:hypothetical protein
MSLRVKEREKEKRVLGQGSQWEIASPALVKRGAMLDRLLWQNPRML